MATTMLPKVPSTSCVPPPGLLASPHPLSVYDLANVRMVAAPILSPRGTAAVVAVSEPLDGSSPHKGTQLWLHDLTQRASTPPRRLTGGTAGASSPCWSPDGRDVAFLLDGGIQLVSRDGTVQRELLRLPVPVKNLQWTCGWLLFSAKVRIGMTMQETAQVDKQDAASAAFSSNAMVYDQLVVRHWDKYVDPRKRSHVFMVPVSADQHSGQWRVDTERVIDVNACISMPASECPIAPFGGADCFQLSPDGNTLLLGMHYHRNSSKYVQGRDHDVWLVDVAAVMAGRTATDDQHRVQYATQPVFSHDGRHVAWLRSKRAENNSNHVVVCVGTVVPGDGAGAAPRVVSQAVLTEAWDLSPQFFSWSADDTQLFVVAEEDARSRVFVLSAAIPCTRSPQCLVAEHWVSAPVAVAPNDVLYLLRSSSTVPDEVYRLDARSRQPVATRITSYTMDAMRNVRCGSWQQVSFPGDRGDIVRASVFLPADYDATKTYPMIVKIHGGPQGCMGDSWHMRWNEHVYASAGYIVMAPNFHGSTGWGTAFTDSITGDWGGVPFRDVVSATKHMIGSFNVDADRIGLLGTSFGGFMVNWILGQPEAASMFRAAATHCSIFDTVAGYFTTEDQYFFEAEFNGNPMQRGCLAERWNPRAHAHKWNTPTLVMHGERDFRLPVTQGLAVFTALQRRGVPSRFIHLPTENHLILDPRNAVFVYRNVIAWMDHFVGNASAQVQAKL